MIVTREWGLSGADVQAWDDGGITLFRTRGVVSPEVMPHIFKACGGAMSDWRTQGLVADYGQAALEIKPDVILQSALNAAAHNGALTAPTALLVQRDHLPLWHTYADLMARNGILRGVFTEQDKALKWVRLQAVVFTADQARRNQASGR